jgi:antitoxin StbD
MGALLETASQAVSVTEVSRSAKTIFEKLRKGERDRLLVLKNNTPAAVMLSVAAFEALMEELDDLRIDAVARGRLRTLKRSRSLSHRQMLRRFGAAPRK